jgi:hypothetical protein
LRFLLKRLTRQSIRKELVHLTTAEQHSLESLVAKGERSATVVNPATALLELKRGSTGQARAESLNINYHTVAKINWQFSLEAARTKFNRQYHQVCAANARCLKT